MIIIVIKFVNGQIHANIKGIYCVNENINQLGILPLSIDLPYLKRTDNQFFFNHI